MSETIFDFSGEYHFLSNFFVHEIEYEGIKYPSTEHAYQATKSLDPEYRHYVASLSTPNLAKKAGRKCSIRPDWEKIKYKVMHEVCSIKFRDENLRKKLENTGSSVLIEGNTWHDNIWGVCRCRKCPGSGTNLLGRCLMEIRNDIKLTNLFQNENRFK